jgi:hypothetical protein
MPGRYVWSAPLTRVIAPGEVIRDGARPGPTLEREPRRVRAILVACPSGEDITP